MPSPFIPFFIVTGGGGGKGGYVLLQWWRWIPSKPGIHVHRLHDSKVAFPAPLAAPAPQVGGTHGSLSSLAPSLAPACRDGLMSRSSCHYGEKANESPTHRLIEACRRGWQRVRRAVELVLARFDELLGDVWSLMLCWERRTCVHCACQC